MSELEKALSRLKMGKPIILVDDMTREDEGDLVIAAEKITPEGINFMIQKAHGLVCLSLSEEMVNRLQLPMMVKHNSSQLQTAFTVSIEAKEGVGSGVSARDRARTIQVAVNPASTIEDLVMPGHVFPLKAREGGVLARKGHTEGSVDLMKLAGLTQAAVICEILNEEGLATRGDSLKKFAAEHDLPIISVQDIVTHRWRHETIVQEIANAQLPIEQHGHFSVRIFKAYYDQAEHVALIKAPYDSQKPVLVRIHSECLTGDVLGSLRCDCGAQRDAALEQIAREGGVLLYVRQEGRGVGLANKIKAYALQEQGYDTVEANAQLGLPIDDRSYGVCAQILKQLGISRVRLLTNNPKKIEDLQRYGLSYVERLPLEVGETTHNQAYLAAKKTKLGHWLSDLKMNEVKK